LALLAIVVAVVTVTLHEAAHLAVAYSLLLAAVQLQGAGASVPTPCWVPPPRVWRAWEAICSQQEL